MAVSKSEFLWCEWILGEARYAGKGPRSQPRPDVGYGDPTKGQKPVPQEWWKRLEAFLTRRDDKAETPLPVPQLPAGYASPHFHISEFDCHDGRKVPAFAVPALRDLCARFLEPMRTAFGPALVMSGYRPADYNARIGGAKFSQHIYELTPQSVAADLIFRTGTPGAWAQLADQLGAGGVGRYPSFVHVDNRPERARWTG
jgi:hypothetical protein